MKCMFLLLKVLIYQYPIIKLEDVFIHMIRDDKANHEQKKPIRTRSREFTSTTGNCKYHI